MTFDLRARHVVAICSAPVAVWDWDGVNWLPRTTSAGPGARGIPSLAYDARRQIIAMHGGNGAMDTWELDGSTWTPSFSPPAGSTYTVSYEPNAGVTWFVENDGRAQVGVWVLRGAQWTNETVAATVDTPLVWLRDPIRARLVGIGGAFGETWSIGWQGAGADETCAAGVDADGDGLAGCADLDCWAVCTPTCPPGVPACP